MVHVMVREIQFLVILTSFLVVQQVRRGLNVTKRFLNSDFFKSVSQQTGSPMRETFKSVNFLASVMKVMSGFDGITIAMFSPGGEKFLIINGIFYTCDGTITENTGECYGTMHEFQFQFKEDFCFANPNSVINNMYCISASGGTISSFINGQVKCSSFDGRAVLLIPIDEYNAMCRRKVAAAGYKYLTNNRLETTGNGLQCGGHSPQVCTLYVNKQRERQFLMG